MGSVEYLAVFVPTLVMVGLAAAAWWASRPPR